MTWQGWAEIALTLSLAVAIGWPLGVFLSRVWNGEKTFLDPVMLVPSRACSTRLRR